MIPGMFLTRLAPETISKVSGREQLVCAEAASATLPQASTQL